MNESMNIQQAPKAEENSFEKIKADISKKLEDAENNPLDINRYNELNSQISEQREKFFKTGTKTPEDLEIDKKIMDEILTHGAIVSTLPEYGEMLNQYAEQNGLDKKWRDDLLAHENAHANVSAEVGNENIGYGIFFISEDIEHEDPRNIAPKIKKIYAQPAHVNIDPSSATPMEVIENGIRILEAPRDYGNEMSPDDITERGELLKRREEAYLIAEQKRQQDLLDVRKSLGI